MATQEDLAELTQQAIIHLGALSMVVGAALAIVNQEIPDFKQRALAVLQRRVIEQAPQFVNNLDAQVIMRMAAQIFNGLEDV